MAKKSPPAQSDSGYGVILSARNGDVIRYDPSGLELRLSDRVIHDIAQRLPARNAPSPTDASTDIDGSEYLSGVDAWDVRQKGEWLHFSARLPGRQGVRGFRRLVSGGAIVADSVGPVYGILGLGGARAALASAHGSDFPQHVLAPADDIGAVGHAGVDHAARLDRLEHLREMTHDALVADTLLGWQMERYDALPLFMTRVETDQSHSISALRRGPAIENLVRAAENLSLAATRMGKKARLMCVTLDFALEDTISNAVSYRDGMLALMDQIEHELARLGFRAPVFVARFDSGTPPAARLALTEGQWELAWNHGNHRFVHSAPGYMFATDDYDRPTENARREMAEMTAAAVSEADTWRCPTFFLAERTRDPATLRVTARALTELHIDAGDPFQAGPGAGFALTGTDARIDRVAIDPDDPQALLLHCDRAAMGDAVRLSYACSDTDGVPGCGAIRDGWALTSATGRRLHRWALPCILPVHDDGGDLASN